MKIAAICALPKLNPGMLSVDAALSAVLERNGIEADVQYFSLRPAHVSEAGSSRFQARTYAALSDSSVFEDFDTVLIWGDFLHASAFHDDMVLHLKRSAPDLTARELKDHIYRNLLLEGAPESILRKTICFGGSIYINDARDDWDERYRAAVSRLYSTARLVLKRDPLSAAFAQQYGAPGSALGVDAAFLLDRMEDRAPGDTGIVGYSFGRGVGASRLATLQARWFVHLCRRKAKLAKAVDLKWLERDPVQPMASLEAKLHQIKRCAFVVTDTYHCAINAWREGVPAICIGYGTEDPTDPLSEKKKELLYSMLNARQFYVFAERLMAGKAGREAGRVVSLLNEGSTAAAVKRNIDVASIRSEGLLADALRAPHDGVGSARG